MGRSHDGLGSPQETPHFPKDFAGFRMTEKKMRKNAFSCCKYPNVGFRVSPSTAIKPKKNGTNTMNENITSAAPELLSALKSLTLEIESILSHEAGKTRDQLLERLHMDWDGKLRAARFAISKANGRTN